MFENETIESIEDWNTLLVRGDGFALPIHPSARVDFQAKFVEWHACGWYLGKIQEGIGIVNFTWPDDVPCPERTRLYRKVEVTRTLEDSTVLKNTGTANPFAQFSVHGFPDDYEFTGDYIPGPLTVDEITLSNPVTTNFVVGEADAKINTGTWASTYSECALFSKTMFSCNGSLTSNPAYVQARAIRYRIGVPDGYELPYFNVKWDEVFYPKAWLEWNAADPETRGDEPSKPKIIKSREWTYSNSEFSDWFEIDRPGEEGKIHIRNIRTLAYRTPWGNAPHFQGERFKP